MSFSLTKVNKTIKYARENKFEVEEIDWRSKNYHAQDFFKEVSQKHFILQQGGGMSGVNKQEEKFNKKRT